MKTFTCRNVNDGFVEALWWIKVAGKEESTRNGRVLSYQAPVIVEFTHPRERVHFCPVRDANPYFHCMEAMWMLAGKNDVDWPAYFAANLANYSDDGRTLHGAYGFRWFKLFGDQVTSLIEHLKFQPNTRRAVLQMWGAEHDLHRVESSKDVPCNTHIYFRPHDNVLDMTVCNRSNDLVWGLFGANAVHMSFLHEYVAAYAGYSVGSYFQMTNNLHVYEQHFPLVKNPPPAAPGPTVSLTDIWLSDGHPTQTKFDADLFRFMTNPKHPSKYAGRFFRGVIVPMYQSYVHYKERNMEEAVASARQIEDSAWAYACEQWLGRRKGFSRA
jgi:thymidylate synthase